MNFKLGIRLLAFAAALCMAACDFEDINHNPHEPTDILSECSLDKKKDH